MIKIFFYLKCGFDPKVLRQFFEEHGEAVSFFGALPPPRAPNKSKTLYGVNSARGEGERNRLWWTRWDLNPRPPGYPAPKFVDPKGFEPLTSRMQTECSTIELKARVSIWCGVNKPDEGPIPSKARNGRTVDESYSTTELQTQSLRSNSKFKNQNSKLFGGRRRSRTFHLFFIREAFYR